MTIEIRDASLEARIQKQLQATGSSSVEQVPRRQPVYFDSALRSACFCE
jgi:hypothetical protein